MTRQFAPLADLGPRVRRILRSGQRPVARLRPIREIEQYFKTYRDPRMKISLAPVSCLKDKAA